MALLVWLIAGLVAGVVASQLPKKKGDHLWFDIAVGLLGSAGGGALYNEFFGKGDPSLTVWSVVAAVAAGAAALAIYHRFMAREKR